MKYVILTLLAVFTAIHLYHSYRDDDKKRKYTKPFLLLLILAYYLTSTKDYSYVLIAALITSWLGDVLLIPHGNLWFTFGGLSFMAAHVLFIIVYTGNFGYSKMLLLFAIPAAVIYYGISAVIIHTLSPSTPKVMLLPMYFYLLSNSTMNIFALMQLVSLKNAGSVIAYVGAVLFFISDCTLFLVRYYKNKDLVFKRHFTVMLTYVVGELLITQGVLMLS